MARTTPNPPARITGDAPEVSYFAGAQPEGSRTRHGSTFTNAIAGPGPATQQHGEIYQSRGRVKGWSQGVTSGTDENTWTWADAYSGYAPNLDVKMELDADADWCAASARTPKAGTSAGSKVSVSSSSGRNSTQDVRKSMSVRIPSVSAWAMRAAHGEMPEESSDSERDAREVVDIVMGDDNYSDGESFEDAMREVREAVERHAEYDLWDIHDPDTFGPIGLVGEPRRTLPRDG
ncbi:hypothetical protein C2E23DRAFT_904025 [Lenzites betulinus]|nr:hypothetical protein C2E23DRAFT_904025 [Lenzites betulinus]